MYSKFFAEILVIGIFIQQDTTHYFCDMNTSQLNCLFNIPESPFYDND